MFVVGFSVIGEPSSWAFSVGVIDMGSSYLLVLCLFDLMVRGWVGFLRTMVHQFTLFCNAQNFFKFFSSSMAVLITGPVSSSLLSLLMAEGAELKFLSFNVRGLNNPMKRVAILDLLCKRGVQIALLQETHIVRRDVNCLSNKFFWVIAYSSAMNKTKGVAIICRRNLRFELLGTWSDNGGRIAIAKIQIENRDIAIASIYAPNAFDGGFYDLATKSLLDLIGFKVVIGADFNAVMDHSIDRSGQSESLD